MGEDWVGNWTLIGGMKALWLEEFHSCVTFIGGEGDWVTRGTLMVGKMKEEEGLPPWLTFVGMMFCVEVAMMLDVKVGTLTRGTLNFQGSKLIWF